MSKQKVRSFPLPPAGYRKDGRPFYPILGGDDTAPATLEEALRRIAELQRSADGLRSDLTRERDRRQTAETREQEQRRVAEERTSQRDGLQQQVNAGSGDVDRRIAEARTAALEEGRQAANAEWQPRLVQVSAQLVNNHARQAAIDAGVRPEQSPPENGPDRVSRFLALADLNGITADDGTVNAEELATRVRAAATSNPEFVSASSPGRSYSAAPMSGQGASGGPPNQLGDAVEAAAAAMRKTLRIPEPAQTGT